MLACEDLCGARVKLVMRKTERESEREHSLTSAFNSIWLDSDRFSTLGRVLGAENANGANANWIFKWWRINFQCSVLPSSALIEIEAVCRFY